ncbi:ciliary microtubule-associated protein 3 isoform X1 [Pan troglodytes]|uniref:ciliary microtubule-associated protein 3 isoform X1 n=1 Tax=Pan troglodytes TaxID=9598 RepID=UPI000D09E5F0|nr:protein pitchfork isoform X1 [Pan troglodytes]
MEIIHERSRLTGSSPEDLFLPRMTEESRRSMLSSLPGSLRGNKTISWIRQPYIWNFGNDAADNYPFGTCQQRKLFPHFHPPNLIGNKFVPLRGSPHRGPGCYFSDGYGLAYDLSKIPTSIKGYTLGARTAVRFKPIQKEMTPHAGKYQNISPQQEKHKQNFAPFNVLVPRFKNYPKDTYYPSPGAYNPEKKPPPKIAWPMKFGSPDWAQVPCLQKRTLKAELSTDKDFRKHRNRVAYLSLYYN